MQVQHVGKDATYVERGRHEHSGLRDHVSGLPTAVHQHHRQHRHRGGPASAKKNYYLTSQRPESSRQCRTACRNLFPLAHGQWIKQDLTPHRPFRFLNNGGAAIVISLSLPISKVWHFSHWFTLSVRILQAAFSPDAFLTDRLHPVPEGVVLNLCCLRIKLHSLFTFL